MIYRYDGSFAGLLSVLHRIFAWREAPTAINAGDPAQDDLVAAPATVATDPGRAEALLAAVDEHLSADTARNLRHAFFSETEGIEMTLYRYLAFGWKARSALDEHIARPEVAAVHRLVRRVGGEAHRFKGLVRFRETGDGLLYAPISPDHFVLPLVAPHFAARLAGERWLIHDLRRGRGALYDGRRWILADLEIENPPTLSAEELAWQDLWRRFFHRIAIAERLNPRQQRSCMPMKYWTYLVEMS